MTYRGKKYLEAMRLLEKKSVLSDDDLGGKGRHIQREAEYTAPKPLRAIPSAYSLADIFRCASPAYAYETYEPKPDSKAAQLADEVRHSIINFMGGISYTVNPMDTLKMITASSVFGEPQYYRDGDTARATILEGTYGFDRSFIDYCLDVMNPYRGLTTSQVMEKAIDEALDADFGGVLNWAVELRERYLMRLNPQVIMVRASKHPGRTAFTEAHPGKFSEIAQKVMSRGDDVINQIQYWLVRNGSKRGIPAVLKRSWAKRIGSMDAYSMAKYGNAGIGLVDAVRISHAKGKLVNTLMREGRVGMPEGENTWERLRASGKSWQEILKTIRLPHMALLRNLRGIFSEVEDSDIRSEVLENLKRGVLKGRQFPFRYLSAYKALQAEGYTRYSKTLQALEECMNIACANLPKMPGRSAFLSDNSGSAWGTCTSEYGTMDVAEIGNLSGVIGAMSCDEGVVFPFGDELGNVQVNRDEGVLAQAQRVSELGRTLGGATENGVWLFFRDALLERQHWDNIFIYSDMQAGHGGLYGSNPADYQALDCCIYGNYIDVNALVNIYRERINPRVNVYCIQTAGYDNVVVPEYGYRTAILYGWTGKELIFADAMRRIWDEIENRKPGR